MYWVLNLIPATFHWKQKVYFIFYSKYCPSEAKTFAHILYDKWIPRFLRRSIHRSIFRYLQKPWNSMMTKHSEWPVKNDNQIHYA